ncbi:hypothetical protein BOO92_13875 [Vibrio navarrensis]|uniref:ParB family protein n=1 Tax=Vibrio navarrensis TaxID=29495 RepID=UPI0018667F67|nr:ParB family protein [Vibrio navarrensis]HAS6102125.1 hypothetical protein [Vibrio vulnificus]EHA1127109.1 hypothetical protein [Vibrio navarrensis]MBE3657766.1 hypothetical protein [Vibrio navarrensis]MBH9739926.1 hypothetical protein [Vibrio navarrensis]HDY8122781.1 chromosome partitioning protein ParB [Vibrio vulnificus]
MTGANEAERDEYLALKKLHDDGKLPPMKKITYSRLHRLYGSENEQVNTSVEQVQTAKLTRTFCDGQLTAERVVIRAQDVARLTQKHPLNLRNQEALSLDAVRDIYPSIKEEGVNVEGVAVLDRELNIYLLLDSSRRRYCAIAAEKDLPLWVLSEPTPAQIMQIIKDSQKVKRWSYREEGKYFLSVKMENGFAKNEELASYLGIGIETVRKKVQAAEIADELVKVFPDQEGVPNTFYAKLAKIEKLLQRNSYDVTSFVNELKHEIDRVTCIDSLSIEKKQKLLLDVLVSQATTKFSTAKAEWATETLAQFDDEKKYARRISSPDGNVVRFEFARLERGIIKEIEDFIASKLAQ